jgi:hypothetical protein
MNTPQNDKINRILQSLDDMQPVPAPDFFYTRLIARMEKEQAGERSWLSILKPAFVAAGLFLLFGVNIYVLTHLNKESNGLQTPSVESFSSAYSLTGHSVYNENDQQP